MPSPRVDHYGRWIDLEVLVAFNYSGTIRRGRVVEISDCAGCKPMVHGVPSHWGAGYCGSFVVEHSDGPRLRRSKVKRAASLIVLTEGGPNGE